ncbi:MAG: MFS transporter, partial [Dehalococcoidia bacterium]|nr:MFS transporter [Dehalococcoidia bacterium]
NTVLSIFAGVLADRVDNRKLLMFSEGIYLASSLSIGILTVAGRIAVWEIAVLLLLHGMSGAISNPSRQVFIHDTVGRERLMSAVSLTNSLFQCMTFIGPAVAGVLIAAVGPGITYLINSVIFVPAIVVMATIRVAKQPRSPAVLSPWQSSVEGLRHVRSTPLLLGLLALSTVPALLVGESVTAMMPIFATQVLNTGVEGMGFLLSANGLGAILAALAISYLGGLRHKGLLVVITSFLYGAFLISFSFSSWYWVSMAMLAGAGATYVVSQTVINTSLQLGVSDDMRGRVMGLYSFGTLGVRSFNGPLIGLFASALGAPLALGTLGGLVMIGVIIITMLTPERRELD